MHDSSREERRKRVAQEAAELLYSQQEKEYRQSKLRAAKNLSVNILPSNAEIADELDRIAEEKEGKSRKKRLVQMRREALQIMKALEDFSPVLVGSVWRGTIHHSSDIDISTLARNPKKIVQSLEKHGYGITETREKTVVKKGEKQKSFHVQVMLPSYSQAEIVVRNPDDITHQARCEIYGDKITGLTTQKLNRLMKQDPHRKFVPT